MRSVGTGAGDGADLLYCDPPPLGLGGTGFNYDDSDPEGLKLQAQTVTDRFKGELGGMIPGAKRGVDLAACL